MHPQTINQEWSEVVEAVNGHKLTALSEQLAALRH
jgi:hypothetical protein